jgi:hypothetical protein
MDDCLGGEVIFAPNEGRHVACLAIDRDNVELVAARALDWGDLEPEQIVLAARALDVDCYLARGVRALNAGTVAALTDRTCEVILGSWD